MKKDPKKQKMTELDYKILDLCMKISNSISENIVNGKDFISNWGNIKYSRHASMGHAGKLQRDALTTRGITKKKSPLCNRNFRWHPIIVAKNRVPYAKPIESINLRKDKLVITIKENGKRKKYTSENVYKIKGRYVITEKNWEPLNSKLKNLSDEKWSKNTFAITSLESCDWQDAVETYAILVIAVASTIYKGDFNKIYDLVVNILKEQNVDKKIKLPSKKFPKKIKDDIVKCPMTRLEINKNLDKFRINDRSAVWQPTWKQDKRNEGDDSSLQIMHVDPLIEMKQKHSADNVRYGFRWANIAMTDHSKTETLNFMKFILKANKKV